MCRSAWPFKPARTAFFHGLSGGGVAPLAVATVRAGHKKGFEGLVACLEALVRPFHPSCEKETELIERMYRKWSNPLPMFSDTSIPLSALMQTAVMGFFAVTVRWSSVLVAVVVAASVWRGISLSAEALAVLVPVIWGDRTMVTYLRIRRQ